MAGRPTKITEVVLAKLEEAFLMGCPDTEACAFAGISPDALYDYQKKFPEFLQRKSMLKENPFLKARRTIVENLSEPEHAKWYLERKKKGEFAQKTEVDSTVTFEPVTITFEDEPKKND